MPFESKIAANSSIWLLTSLLLSIAIAGCGGSDGPPRVAVRGTVTFDGQPLDRGSIEFIPTAGTHGPMAAAEIVDGKYDLDDDLGPVVGKLRVEIHSIAEPSFALDDPREFAAHKPRISSVAPDRIPPTFNRQSILTATTSESGENTFDFTLTSKP